MVTDLRMYPIVRLTWNDHSSYDTNCWREINYIKENLTPTKVETVGFLIKETEDFYLVVSTISTSENATGEFAILKKAVLFKEVLVDGHI